jgi:penicillin-binding protein 1A
VSLGGRKMWAPRNFEGTFDGRVTVRDALVRSKNVPTIRLAENVGIDDVAQLAERAGVEPPIPREPSMPLGTVAVSPLELATAYTAFARLGSVVRPRVVTRVESPEGEVLWEAEPETADVMPPATAYLIDDVLGEALARGTGTAVRAAGFDAPAAGKTGTTNDGADAWFVGYTPDVVAAVWIGYDDPAPIVPRATGGRLAAPVWARTMLRFYEGRARPAPWTQPAGVIEAWVDPATGMRLSAGCRPAFGAAYRELFLDGRAPRETCPTSGSPETLAVEAVPLEGYEEFTGEPDLPPIELERTTVPPEEPAEELDAEAEAAAEEPDEESPRPTPSPRPAVATPRPSPSPTPADASPEAPEPSAEVAPTPAPTVRPSPTPTEPPGARG